MKRNDITALHGKEIAELKTQLVELQNEWFKAKLQKSAGKSENPAKIGQLADDVARIKTVIREKELAGNLEVAA